MNPVMYIVINRGLGMSTGKTAAQAAHAAVLASHWHLTLFLAGYPTDAISRSEELYNEWIESGHYTKLVLEASDTEKLYTMERYIKERGYETFMVIDEGRTEIEAHQPTAFATEVVDKDNELVQKHFGYFPLYKDDRKKKGLFRG